MLNDQAWLIAKLDAVIKHRGLSQSPPPSPRGLNRQSSPPSPARSKNSSRWRTGGTEARLPRSAAMLDVIDDDFCLFEETICETCPFDKPQTLLRCIPPAKPRGLEDEGLITVDFLGQP